MPIVNFRRAGPGDVDYLTQLRLRTIHEHIRNAGTDLSYEEHELRARTRLECCSILSVADRTVGMIKVIRTEDSWTIEQFQIEPECQRRGLGGAVVAHVQQDAKATGARLFLGVLRSNPALRLYERLGFRPIREANGVVEMESAA